MPLRSRRFPDPHRQTLVFVGQRLSNQHHLIKVCCGHGHGGSLRDLSRLDDQLKSDGQNDLDVATLDLEHPNGSLRQ